MVVLVVAAATTVAIRQGLRAVRSSTAKGVAAVVATEVEVEILASGDGARATVIAVSLPGRTRMMARLLQARCWHHQPVGVPAI